LKIIRFGNGVSTPVPSPAEACERSPFAAVSSVNHETKFLAISSIVTSITAGIGDAQRGDNDDANDSNG
jgi:hypothetical protein